MQAPRATPTRRATTAATTRATTTRIVATTAPTALAAPTRRVRRHHDDGATRTTTGLGHAHGLGRVPLPATTPAEASRGATTTAATMTTLARRPALAARAPALRRPTPTATLRCRCGRTPTPTALVAEASSRAPAATPNLGETTLTVPRCAALPATCHGLLLPLLDGTRVCLRTPDHGTSTTDAARLTTVVLLLVCGERSTEELPTSATWTKLADLGRPGDRETTSRIAASPTTLLARVDVQNRHAGPPVHREVPRPEKRERRLTHPLSDRAQLLSTRRITFCYDQISGRGRAMQGKPAPGFAPQGIARQGMASSEDSPPSNG
jgi:hypothetical protein